jgi:hypothetical protein
MSASPTLKKSRAGKSHHRRGATKRAFICFRWPCAPGHREGRRQCYESNSRAIIGSRDQRTFSSGERPNACIWNNYPAMPPISIPMRVSGTISSEGSWAMSLVPISISCIASSSKPTNVCATRRRSSKVAPESRGYLV